MKRKSKKVQSLTGSELAAILAIENQMCEALSQALNTPLYSLIAMASEFDWSVPRLRKSISAGTFPQGIVLAGKTFWLYDELVEIQDAKRNKWSSAEMRRLVAEISIRRRNLLDWVLDGLSVIWLNPDRENV